MHSRCKMHEERASSFRRRPQEAAKPPVAGAITLSKTSRSHTASTERLPIEPVPAFVVAGPCLYTFAAHRAMKPDQAIVCHVEAPYRQRFVVSRLIFGKRRGSQTKVMPGEGRVKDFSCFRPSQRHQAEPGPAPSDSDHQQPSSRKFWAKKVAGLTPRSAEPAAPRPTGQQRHPQEPQERHFRALAQHVAQTVGGISMRTAVAGTGNQ
jgi:hypothetical protein